MVRVNIINPKYLSDQHLVAEYLEILMLVSHARKFHKKSLIPSEYCLGKGHINFFKNKILYLSKRHELLKKEMKKRGFKTEKTLSLKGFSKEFLKDWRNSSKDKICIKKRLIERIKRRPNYYRYYGEKKSTNFFIELIKKA